MREQVSAMANLAPLYREMALEAADDYDAARTDVKRARAELQALSERKQTRDVLRRAGQIEKRIERREKDAASHEKRLERFTANVISGPKEPDLMELLARPREHRFTKVQ